VQTRRLRFILEVETNAGDKRERGNIKGRVRARAQDEKFGAWEGFREDRR